MEPSLNNQYYSDVKYLFYLKYEYYCTKYLIYLLYDTVLHISIIYVEASTSDPTMAYCLMEIPLLSYVQHDYLVPSSFV